MNAKLILAGILSLAISGNALAADYTIDPDHSSVGFKVKHLAISTVPGKFAHFSGTFSYDEKSPAEAKAEAEIKVQSIDTGNQKRDDHLRSGDFFLAEKFPEIKFVSKEVKPGSDGQMAVVGDLTIRGVTKPVTLDVKFEGSGKDMYGKDRAAFVGTTKISRKEFGVNWNKVLETGGLVVGDEVQIEVSVEGTKIEGTKNS